MGFSRPQIRAAALELLHEEEWDVEPPPKPAQSEESQPSAVMQAETHPDAPDALQAFRAGIQH